MLILAYAKLEKKLCARVKNNPVTDVICGPLCEVGACATQPWNFVTFARISSTVLSFSFTLFLIAAIPPFNSVQSLFHRICSNNDVECIVLVLQ